MKLSNLKFANIITVIAFLSLSLTTLSCKEEVAPQPDKKLAITNIEPIAGCAETEITITGENFSLAVNSSGNSTNVVKIGNTIMTLIGFSTTKLKFRIPFSMAAGTYPVTITVGNNTVEYPQKFTVQPLPTTYPAEVESYNYVIGTQNIGASYKFTGDSKLIEPAKRMWEMGSNIMKIHLGYSTNTAAELQKVGNENKMIIDMPFNHYFFWVYTDYNQWWKDGMSASDSIAEYSNMYNLTKYLLQTYNNTNKKFYFGHWEGDWLLTETNPAMTAVDPVRIKGMIDWLNIRQRAIDQAKLDVPHSNVDVFHYVEVNRVVDAMQNNYDRIANRILPYTNVDFVSYSSYDAIGHSDYSSTNSALVSALNYIESKLKPKPSISGKRVFIGEYGYALIGSDGVSVQNSATAQNTRSKYVMKSAITWGCPFVLYWEMYNNEVVNGVQRGFWLINDKNEKQPIYYTHENFIKAGKAWVNNYFTTNKKLPSYDEFKAWAITSL